MFTYSGLFSTPRKSVGNVTAYTHFGKPCLKSSMSPNKSGAFDRQYPQSFLDLIARAASIAGPLLFPAYVPSEQGLTDYYSALLEYNARRDPLPVNESELIFLVGGIPPLVVTSIIDQGDSLQVTVGPNSIAGALDNDVVKIGRYDVSQGVFTIDYGSYSRSAYPSWYTAEKGNLLNRFLIIFMYRYGDDGVQKLSVSPQLTIPFWRWV